MQEKTVVGIFKDTTSAEKALSELREVGISDADISRASKAEDVNLVGLKIKGHEVKVYEGKTKDGKALLAAKTVNPTLIKDIFTKHDVEEINEYD